MDFYEVLDQVAALLQKRKRVTYGALKLQFKFDDEQLQVLKEELIEAQQVAVDEDGKVLVWVGQGSLESRVQSLESTQVQGPESKVQRQKVQTLDPRPVTYTPQHLAERIRAEQAALEARGATDGERKTITALFADLKGSTALIEGLDPEEARAIIDPALQLMMDAVHRYEGYVAQALGDGIFALFGAPIAHEDHPQRALYAALRMQEEMRRYADTLRTKGYPPLLMRVGINTGEVVLRSIRKDDLHADYVPVGHSTNLAARMEQLAAPGSILVTAHTHKLTDGYFEFKNLGQTQIKGVEELLHIYEVLGAGPLRTRLQVAARRGLTRFVGRTRELEQMQQALEQAKAGHGQIVGVMGEPGLGKSRLFHEFVGARRAVPLLAHGCLILEAYSVSHGKASPYLPVIELLKSYFQIQPQDDERTRRERVIGKVLGLDRSLEETLPYLYALLGIEEQPSPLQQMAPQIRRRRTFEALKKLFLRESLNQPLILIFEDLHWIDGETQGFLDVLSESVASAKVLLLVNYRPEYRSEWGQKTYYTQLRLVPFGKAEAEEFLDVLLGVVVGADLRPKEVPVGRVGPPEPGAHPSTPLRTGSGAPLQALKQLILAKTEGTPFFIEEIVQDLFEQGILVRDAVETQRAMPLPTDLHIPTTVQGVLAARIDRLAPEEKALLQQLAVIGREFPLSLLRQVISQAEDELYRLLSSLQHKEFLYEQPAFPEVEYIFKHALTQEVTYNSVLTERRKALHEQTAQGIEALYHERLDEHYSELAHHYQRSGNTEKAIEYLQKTGQQAAQQSANEEAINHLTVALELLKTLPDTPERARQELTLHLSLGASLIASKGYSTTEVEQTYTRARALCDQLGSSPQRMPVLFGLGAFHLVRGELRTAQALAEECLRLAKQTNEVELLLIAHYAVGITLLWRGELDRAWVALEQSVILYEPQHQALIPLYGGAYPSVSGLNFMALALWLLGYPEQACVRSHEALHLARELGHFYTLGSTLNFAALLDVELGEGRSGQERADAAVALCSEHGFPVHLVLGTICRGAALIAQGQWVEGIARIQQGLGAYTGEVSRTEHLAWLARGYGRAGQVEEGLATVAEALQLVEKNDERFYEAEVYRIKGELTLQKLPVVSSQLPVPKPQPPLPNPQAEAEECFLKAIDIARKQQAKSLELRAVMSLVRLRQHQAQDHVPRNTHYGSQPTQHETRLRLDEAHTMLSEIYNWFTEGFDTKDLQEAKVLLEELAKT